MYCTYNSLNLSNLPFSFFFFLLGPLDRLRIALFNPRPPPPPAKKEKKNKLACGWVQGRLESGRKD